MPAPLSRGVGGGLFHGEPLGLATVHYGHEPTPPRARPRRQPTQSRTRTITRRKRPYMERRRRPSLITDIVLRIEASAPSLAEVTTSRYFTSSSAICTAFSAAPLSSWSPETQKQSPLSNAQSCRILPTWQLYFSAV